MDETNEILDENDNVVGVRTRKEIQKKGLKFKSAIVIVTNSNGRYLTVQRSKTKTKFPLKWGLGAGGGVKQGENFFEAAERELAEETGIRFTPKYLFDFEYLSQKYGSYSSKIFLVNWDGEIKLDPEECAQSKWLSEKEVLKMGKNGDLCPDVPFFFRKYLKQKRN